MNVFGYELSDWKHLNRSFYRHYLIGKYPAISIYPNNESNSMRVFFDFNLYFIEKYLPSTIISGNAEYAKQYIDDFLIKMDKMKAFI